MSRTEKLNERDLAAGAVEEACRKGADAADAFFARGEELVIEVRNQEVENLKVAREEGVGIRVTRGERLGFAYTSDLSRTAVSEAVADALANALVGSTDPYYVFPGPPASFPEMDLDDPGLKEVSQDVKIKIAQEIEQSGRAFDRRIRITEQASYEESYYEAVIANSEGLLAATRGSLCGGFASLVAGDDTGQETGFGLQFTRKFSELDPAAIGREAGFRAVRMLGSRRLETKRAAVVFEPYVVTNFLGLIAAALTAEAVQKGRSLFAGKVGKQVAAGNTTIIDDGALPQGLMSAPFDGEGVPSQRTVLIDGGELKGFLHNSYTAAKAGVTSTGNAARGSFKSPPELGNTNFYLAPGELEPEEIIRRTGSGLLLTEVMGMHTANPISGDFSVGAAGIWIEHGELTTPVRGMVIAGNILELLENIDLVGKDLRFFIGKGAPTIRVAGLTVSGS